MKSRSIVFLIIFMLTCITLFSWLGETHKYLTSCSLWKSKKMNLESFFEKLGFQNREESVLLNGDNLKTIIEWMKLGAVAEDNSTIPALLLVRSDHHFHNPLKIFDEASLADIALTIDKHKSLILWAQDGEKQGGPPRYPEGDNSWKKVREWYFTALTSNDSTKRQENFAYMFKGLGHQVHLIQDSAEPDHTRNDSHPENTLYFLKYRFGTYVSIENWVNNNLTLIHNSFIEVPFPKLTYDPKDINLLVPFYHLVDYGVYNGSNPSDTLEQGLAEYSNANFLSPSSIFRETGKHSFPYPALNSTNFGSIDVPPEVITANDNKPDYARYISKIRDGENIEHFLRFGYLTTRVETNPQMSSEIKTRTMYIDNHCHEDYAKKLIPRAIGYSSALLDYFFRGEIDIQLPEEDGIYGLAPYPEQGFKQITIKAKNMTPDEEMTGKLFLVIRYRPSAGDDWDSATPAKPYQEQEKFIVVEYPEQSVTLPSNEYKKLRFDLPTSLPVSATDVNITLVMHGTLGYEKDIAVAIGFKDISEPTAIKIYNDSDMLCLNGTLLPYWNPTVLDYAETTKRDDIITPGEIDIIPRTIKLWDVIFFDMMPPVPPSRIFFDFAAAPEAEWVEIEAGKSYRMYILTDEGKKTIFRFGYSCKRPSDTIVGYDPPWFSPGYSACNYIWHHMQRPFEITPRQNKLTWNEGAKQFDHVKTDNFYWETKGRYFLNLIYMAQPDAPRNCTTCDPCKAHYPAQGQPWKAQYYDNRSPALKEEQMPFVQILKNRNASGE